MQMERLPYPALPAAKLPSGPLYNSPLWGNPNVARPAQPYIEAFGQFTSERDKHIALHISETLDCNLVEGRLEPAGHAAANASLRALIPIFSPTGKRQIDGKTLPQAAEALIASRLTCPEVDITAPSGSWGRLPEVIKQQLTLHGTDMKLELAANCTVGCNFCALANKGPISAKASFDSSLAVMYDFIRRQDVYNHRPQGGYDSAYWGTDPFDLKWASTGVTPERDYTDLHAAYSMLGAPRYRYLYTSTSVPLGEELRILNFGHKELYRQNLNHTPLRISRTHVNTSRVDHIATVLEAIRPNNRLKINDVREHIAIRGAKWAVDQQVSLWDITGPNCRDGAIIGVHTVDSVIMQGASPERKSGELRQSIEQPYNGGCTYTIPHHQVKPTLNGKTPFNVIYPDTEITTVTVDNNGTETMREERMAGDPHRALLRVAGALINFDRQATATPGPNAASIAVLRQVLGPDVKIIREYITAGHDNRSMHGILGLLAKKGYSTA
jgi:hypothetical protein